VLAASGPSEEDGAYAKTRPLSANGVQLTPVELIETSTFTRQITARLSDKDYGEFQSRLAANPGLGALINVAQSFQPAAPRFVSALPLGALK
jgi:hypothetical protein